ncbi:MAG: LPS export ABC transporter permease LptF [Candidatus Adiutrix sp.]
MHNNQGQLSTSNPLTTNWRPIFMQAPILNRYILSEIAPGFFINILVFTSILLMTRMMGLANLVISKGVGLGVVLEIFFMAMPKILAMALPMATLIAVLMAFLRLSADSELTVLRASGISLYQLLPTVLIFGAAAAVLTAWFSVWLAPEYNWRLKNSLLELAKMRGDLAITEQVFVRSFPGLTLYVGQIPPGTDQMEHVFIHDNRSLEESSVIVARHGRLGIDNRTESLLFYLEDGVIDRVYQNRNAADSIFFSTYELKVSAGDEFGAGETPVSGSRGRSEMPTTQLIAFAKGLDVETKKNVIITCYLEWHRRWAQPVTTLLMAMIGLPLGASFRVRGRNFGLMVGLGVFILYYALFSIGWSLAEKGLISPLIGVWFSNLALLVVGAVVLKQINCGVPIDPWQWVRRIIFDTGKLGPISRGKA